MNNLAPELEAAILGRLFTQKQTKGTVPNRDVTQAAMLLGLHPRSVRRRIQDRDKPSTPRCAWQPSEDLLQRLLDHGGSVAALHRTLTIEGAVTVTVRTMQRGFDQYVATSMVKFARGGFAAAQQCLPTMAMPPVGINDEWAMDDALVPVWCVMPDGTVGKPWMQTVIDAGSRFVLAQSVKPHPFNTEDAVETLACAMRGHHLEDGTFVGGQPRSIRTDRGSTFINRAVTIGLIEHDIVRSFSEAYTPQQNGKIERWHRTIKSMFADIVGYDRSHQHQIDPRRDPVPPPAEDCMSLEELIVEIQTRVRRYNHDLVHSALDMTPAQFWVTQVTQEPGLVSTANVQAIRASMVQETERTLTRRRVKFNKKHYALHPHEVGTDDHDPDEISVRRNLIDATEGKAVRVRYLSGRIEHVSVYTLAGVYLGDAVWETLQTPEQAGETTAARRRAVTTMNTSLENIAQREAAALAVRREQAEDDQTYGYGPAFLTPNGSRPDPVLAGPGERVKPATEVRRERKATKEREARAALAEVFSHNLTG